jgi:mannose/fructose/N-acetylgalactosamine-specific phosphotransferase system component IIC
MVQQYMYSPATPTYSPSYRPLYASYVPKNKTKELNVAGFNFKCHGCFIFAVLLLLFVLYCIRIINDPMYAQEVAVQYPDFVNFLLTMQGKVIVAVGVVIVIYLFNFAYKHNK